MLAGYRDGPFVHLFEPIVDFGRSGSGVLSDATVQPSALKELRGSMLNGTESRRFGAEVDKRIFGVRVVRDAEEILARRFAEIISQAHDRGLRRYVANP